MSANLCAWGVPEQRHSFLPPNTMPKSAQSASAASRNSLRRNQVRLFNSAFIPRLFIHPSRPVLLVVNESWYSIDVSLQLAILRSYLPQRCDAARPHCATCVKYVITGSIANAPDLTLCQTMACSNQRTSSTRIRVSPFSVFCHIDLTAIFSCSHPTEPQCSYDPVEGLPLAPDADPLEKIKELEEQVGAFLYCCLSLTVLICLCSCTHEETEITEGKRIPLSVSISQPSSTSF